MNDLNTPVLFVATAAFLNACFQTTLGVVSGEPVYYFVGAAFLVASGVAYLCAWAWR